MKTANARLNVKILKADRADAPLLDEVIRREFPYTEFSSEKIEERFNDPSFLVLKAVRGNSFTGFADTEFFSVVNEARMNAVYVEKLWRRKKIATKLVKEVLEECRARGVTRVFLLVKAENGAAKLLYKKLDFKFEKMHDKEIEGSKVEVWSRKP